MGDGLSKVFVGPPTQAEIVRSVLEGSGIEVVIRHSGASGAYPINVGALSETVVLVPERDEATARSLLVVDEIPGGPPITRQRSVRRTILWWSAFLVLVITVATLVTSVDLSP